MPRLSEIEEEGAIVALEWHAGRTAAQVISTAQSRYFYANDAYSYTNHAYRTISESDRNPLTLPESFLSTLARSHLCRFLVGAGPVRRAPTHGPFCVTEPPQVIDLPCQSQSDSMG
jgi:hypothetical protein